MLYSQDAICRTQFCEAAYRCWQVDRAKCCWDRQNDTECLKPGVPYGWFHYGNDPVGVSILISWPIKLQ